MKEKKKRKTVKKGRRVSDNDSSHEIFMTGNVVDPLKRCRAINVSAEIVDEQILTTEIVATLP